MRGVRIPQDLNGQDRFVLGLTVGNLAILLFGLLGAYAAVHLAAPLFLKAAGAAAILAITLAVVWLRPEGRSLIHWVGAAIEYTVSLHTDRPVPKPRLTPSRLEVIPASPSSDIPELSADYVVRHEASNLQVLLGSPKCLANPNGPQLGLTQAAELVTTLRAAGHHFILIDLSATLGEFEAQILETADRIICVVTPTATGIQDLYR